MARGGGFRFFPPFIKFLLFSNVAVFAVTALFAVGMTFDGLPLKDVITRIFALQPLESGLFRPWQVVTYQFLHGGVSHIFFNMFALWMFGQELENIWGSKRFATYYLVSGIVAAITHLIVSPMLDTTLLPTVGASGSIMGVLLAFGLTFPNRPVLMFPIFFPIPAKFFVLIYAGLDLINGFMNTSDGIAHFAHLGGALGGFLLLRFGGPLFRLVDKAATGSMRREERVVDARYRDLDDSNIVVLDDDRTPVRTEAPPRQVTRTPTKFIVDGRPITQEEIDEILDRIKDHGYHSLSESDKRILFEVSKQM